MRVKKAIKKVAALMAGASMVGATILGASAAADLSNYPAPFIQNGVFDAVLVVGDDASAQDVIGVTDILASLQFQATTVSSSSSSSGSSSTAIEGDSWMVGTRGDFLELGDGQGGEDFDSQITRVSETELAALADGSTSTEKGTAPYEQFLRLEDGSVVFQENTETDVVGPYAKWENNDIFLNYSLEFTTSWQSDIEDSTGASAAGDVYLTDFEDETITILGSTYTVLKARRVAANKGVKLTLLGGDVTDTIEEGETKTYMIGEKEYEIENTIVTDSGTIYTQLRVNGELTKKLQEDQTVTLADGSILGVADILANEAGDVTGDLVRFYLGAAKIEIQDADLTNTVADSSKLSINDESVSDATVRMTGSNSSGVLSIDTIQIDLASDDQIWLGDGESLVKSPEVDPDTVKALEAMNLDIYNAGLTEEPINEVKIDSVSDDRYELKFKNVDGNEISLPLAYDNDSGTTATINNNLAIWGDKNDRFVIDPNGVGIADDQYFILTDKTNSISGYSEVIQYKGSNKLTDDTPEAKFKLLSTGETVTRSMTSVSTGAKITLNVGGSEYTFLNVSDAGSNNFNINVTGGPAARVHNSVVTEHGLLITLSANSTTGENLYAGNVSVSLVEIAKQMDNRTQPDLIEYAIGASTTEAKVSLTRRAGVTVSSTDYDSDVSEGMNGYGVRVVDSKDSTNPRELTLHVPKNQLLPQVYLTSGVTTASKSSTSSSAVTEIVKIDVGAAQLASKVSGRETSENLILVGGPCANSAAAVIAGVSADTCAEGYVAGKATIKLYEHASGKVALLVAGYNAVDTRAAAQVVANHGNYADFKGMELVVSDTSSASPKVGAPVAAAPVVADNAVAAE